MREVNGTVLWCGSGAFGGYKQSGLGREWGRRGLEDFTEIKNLIWS